MTTGPITASPTLEEALARFLRTLAGAKRSAATVTGYRTDLSRSLAFLRQTHCTINRPCDVARAAVSGYLGSLDNRRLSGVSREWSGSWTPTATSPGTRPSGSRRPRRNGRLGRPFALTSSRNSSPSPSVPRDRAILQMVLRTSARVSEPYPPPTTNVPVLVSTHAPVELSPAPSGTVRHLPCPKGTHHLPLDMLYTIIYSYSQAAHPASGAGLGSARPRPGGRPVIHGQPSPGCQQ